MRKGRTVEILSDKDGLEMVISEAAYPEIARLGLGVYFQHKSRRWEAIAISIIGTLNVTPKERKILNGFKERFSVEHPCKFVVRDGEHF